MRDYKQTKGRADNDNFISAFVDKDEECLAASGSLLGLLYHLTLDSVA